MMKQRLLLIASSALGALLVSFSVPGNSTVSASTTANGATSSQPIALATNQYLVSVNTDVDTVSVFDVLADRNRRLAEIPVQDEPSGVACLANGSRCYIANTVSGTVSVLDLSRIRNGIIPRPTLHINVGTEPYGVALTPNGTKLYVANARSNNVSVIDTQSNAVVRTITNVGFEPRGLAVTNDGDTEDADETVLVTNFLSLPIEGKLDGFDDSKEGFLTRIDSGNDVVLGTVRLNPIADTGFNATGDALARVAPADPTNPANFRFITGAYPNQFNSVAVRGRFAFVPNTGASPNGPVRFDVNTQSLMNVVDLGSNLDAGKTVNLHKFIAQQQNPNRLFMTQPWNMAFENQTNSAWVISLASDQVMKVNLNPADGTITPAFDFNDATRVLTIRTGKSPRGIVINSNDTRAYVMNLLSRDITVIDIANQAERVHSTLVSTASPQPGTQEDKVFIGKQLYHSSTGVFDPATPGGQPIINRLSRGGWGSCGSCHPFGLTDNVVWIFGAGPRRTIPQHTDFDKTDPTRSIQRALNWSAIFDEEEDFENNIRGTSGGAGLIVLSDGVTQDPVLSAFGPPANGGRNQLKVRGVGAWDALKAYIQFGIRTPLSPVNRNEADVVAGEALFKSANCQSCHGGPQWTSSKVRFTPPPASNLIVNGQIISELRNVGTFDPAVANEVRQNAAAPLGAAGFAPASLLGLHAFSNTFFHNGIATSLEKVMDNVPHRSSGTAGVDTLSNPADRDRLIRFLLSIDDATPVINP
jgi:YVTN family beta-propeller protein